MNRQAVLAEALGSGLLFATVIGSGIMAERLAGGNVAVALLGKQLHGRVQIGQSQTPGVFDLPGSCVQRQRRGIFAFDECQQRLHIHWSQILIAKRGHIFECFRFDFLHVQRDDVSENFIQQRCSGQAATFDSALRLIFEVAGGVDFGGEFAGEIEVGEIGRVKGVFLPGGNAERKSGLCRTHF